MPTFGENAYDSEWLSAFAGMALEAGRLEMAEAVVRLALQARKIEKANEPLPAPYLVSAMVPGQPYALKLVNDGPTGNGDADLARAEAAATALMRKPVEPSARCAQLLRDGDRHDPCNEPIYLTTDHKYPNIDGPVWVHVNPGIDVHHDAQPPAGHSI